MAIYLVFIKWIINHRIHPIPASMKKNPFGQFQPSQFLNSIINFLFKEFPHMWTWFSCPSSTCLNWSSRQFCHPHLHFAPFHVDSCPQYWLAFQEKQPKVLNRLTKHQKNSQTCLRFASRGTFLELSLTLLVLGIFQDYILTPQRDFQLEKIIHQSRLKELVASFLTVSVFPWL